VRSGVTSPGGAEGPAALPRKLYPGSAALGFRRDHMEVSASPRQRPPLQQALLLVRMAYALLQQPWLLCCP
jgi:hypothetical protein